MSNDEVKDLFCRVFDNELGRAVLAHLERQYDVGVMPMSAEKEYIKTCQRSVVKYIKSILNKH